LAQVVLLVLLLNLLIMAKPIPVVILYLAPSLQQAVVTVTAVMQQGGKAVMAGLVVAVVLRLYMVA